LERCKAPEWEVRHVGNTFVGERIHQIIVNAVGHVVVVLDAHDRRDRLRLLDLFGAHGAQAKVTNESLLLQLNEGAEGFRASGPGLGTGESTETKIDHVQRLEPNRSRFSRTA